MATLSRGQTFGVTESVTNTKLHNLVDNATITGIVDADISAGAAIQFSKLLASSIDGSLLVNLPNIVSGAGKMPFANLNVPFGSTYVSLISIPNQSLQPLTLASWVSGLSMKNMNSLPSLAGQIPWYSVVGSLASGSIPMYGGSQTLIGKDPSTIVNAYSAGSLLIQSADTSKNISSTTYGLSKEIKLVRSGTLTIKFTLSLSDAVSDAVGRIYRNGVAVGTERTNGSPAPVEYSEDISGWVAGDLCQIYTKKNASGGTTKTLTNFRIYSVIPTVEAVTTDQDN